MGEIHHIIKVNATHPILFQVWSVYHLIRSISTNSDYHVLMFLMGMLIPLYMQYCYSGVKDVVEVVLFIAVSSSPDLDLEA